MLQYFNFWFIVSDYSGKANLQIADIHVHIFFHISRMSMSYIASNVNYIFSPHKTIIYFRLNVVF